ncbi:MAG TPA: NAD(P)-binding protein [Abditibacteriaceae bacterium]|jgi:hypothetical protein
MLVEENFSRENHKESAREQMAAWWAEYRWPVIGILWVVALGLGYWGYQKQSLITEGGRQPLDNLYLAFMLFTFNPIEGVGVGWELRLAGWMAPLMAFVTALQGALVVFRDEIQDYYLSRLNNHVVICGLSEKGRLLAESFRQDGQKVVVIEANENHPAITDCRAKDIFVLKGDATKRNALAKARVRYAKYLIAVCDKDSTNAGIIAQTRELIRDLAKRDSHKVQRENSLLCVVHLADDNLRDLLENKLIAEKQQDLFRLQVFNIYDSAARALLIRHPFDTAAKPHVLIVGLGLLGQNLLERILIRWCSHEMQVTLVAPQATKLVQSLGEVSSLKLMPLDLDVQDPVWRSGAWLEANKDNVLPTVAYVCLEEDHLTFSAGLQLHHWLGEKSQVVLCLQAEGGLTSLLHNWLPSQAEPKIFVVPSETCNANLPLSHSIELLAKAIHEQYRQEKDGQIWEQLTFQEQQENLRAADFIEKRLSAIGCEVHPLGSKKTVPFNFTEEEIEIMAQMEHERWFDSKTQAARRSEAQHEKNKNNVYYKAWNDLNEQQKEDNRQPVRKLAETLRKAGYQIYRLGSAA